MQLSSVRPAALAPRAGSRLERRVEEAGVDAEELSEYALDRRDTVQLLERLIQRHHLPNLGATSAVDLDRGHHRYVDLAVALGSAEAI